MTNTSATGGPLLPNPSPAPAPLEGKALLTFLQNFVVGITGMPGAMVRPRWQSEPPNIPQDGNAWAAIGIMRRPSDDWPFIGHVTNTANPQGADQLQRHESLYLLASFYDDGVSGMADFYASLLRDGLAIDQNREILQTNGMGLIDCEEMLSVPSLIKVRWLYRVDLPFGIRRAIVREYPVLNVEEGVATVVAQESTSPIINFPITN